MVQNASHVCGRECRRLSVHCFCRRISVSQVCAFENSATARLALSRPMGRIFRNRWALLPSVRGEVVARSFYSVGTRARRPNAVGFAVDDVTGIIVLVLFLAMPFYIYRSLRVARSVTETK